jgi:hypothetical protein
MISLRIWSRKRLAVLIATALLVVGLIAFNATRSGAATSSDTCTRNSDTVALTETITCTLAQATTTAPGPTTTVTGPTTTETVTTTATATVTNTVTNTVTVTATPTTTAPTTTTPPPPPPSTYPDAGTTGYLGATSALTVYSQANGVIPAGCTSWNATYKYLRCDQANLSLDHAWVKGGIYWTGCGNLNVTQSIIEWAPSSTWHDVYAQCANGTAGATLSVTDSTLRSGTTYNGGSDIGAVTTNSTRPMLVNRSNFSGFPQGLDPAGGSLIQHSEIYATDGAQCGSSTCHGDGLFSQGGNNITYDSNRVVVATSGTVTAAVFWQVIPCTLQTGEIVKNNYLQGGAYTFRNECSAVSVTDNVFAGAVYGDAYSAAPGTITAWTGNKHPDGSTVPSP